MDLRPKDKVFLNNNVGNVILEAGAIYEVSFPNDILSDFKTILCFKGQYANGYAFKILCHKHLHQFAEINQTTNDIITYQRDILRSAIFKRSNTLDVLYGSKT